MNVSVKPRAPAENDRHDAVRGVVTGSDANAKQQSRRLYRCPLCGHELCVFGGGRHRIYFPIENAQLDEPIMDHACPECGRPIPSTDAD